VRARGVLAAALAAGLIAGHADAQESAHARLALIMDSVFGHGAWRLTGGYRTPEREDELRAQGAMTVRPGGLSRHSLGTPDAPGAYDIVVDGMSPFEAAERLRRAGAPFARYMPKRAHGTQGPHLHLEPYSFYLSPAGLATPILVQASYGQASYGQASYGRARAHVPHADTGGEGLIVIEEGVRRRRTPEPVVAAPPPPPAPTEDPFARLRAAAMRDDPQAQLDLGRAYLAGELTRRDVRAAVKWIQLASSNPKADDKLRDDAAAALDGLASGLEQDYAAHRLAGLR
jgi:hypothetical protein